MNRRSLLRFFLGSTIAAAIERFTTADAEANCSGAYRRCLKGGARYCAAKYWWSYPVARACFGDWRRCCHQVTADCNCDPSCKRCVKRFKHKW